MIETLWRPIKAGDLELNHRLAMAPMTRSRSTPAGIPTEMNAEYYAQRASTALIISEGTQPSDDGQGYILTPGIYTDAQIAGWRKVTDAVHSAGGKIVIQLMHVGRIAHPANTPHGRQPVAPSAVQPKAKIFTMTGLQDIPSPRALTESEVASTVQDYRNAAAAAIKAGADAIVAGSAIFGSDDYAAAISRIASKYGAETRLWSATCGVGTPENTTSMRRGLVTLVGCP